MNDIFPVDHLAALLCRFLHLEHVVVTHQVLKTSVKYSFNIMNPEGTTCHVIHLVVRIDDSHGIREQHICTYYIQGGINNSFLWVEEESVIVEDLLQVLTHRLHSSEMLQEGRGHENQAVGVQSS